MNLGWLVLGEDGAAAVHAGRVHRAAAPATTSPIKPEPRSSSSGRGLTVGRPLGLILTRKFGERHGHAVPHRDP
jgi:hypothetical protein